MSYFGRIVSDTMQDLSDEDRRDVLGEVLMDELKAIREGIANLPTRQEFNALQDVVDELSGDMKVVKAAVTDQSSVLKDYGSRITALENVA